MNWRSVSVSGCIVPEVAPFGCWAAATPTARAISRTVRLPIHRFLVMGVFPLSCELHRTECAGPVTGRGACRTASNPLLPIAVHELDRCRDALLLPHLVRDPHLAPGPEVRLG